MMRPKIGGGIVAAAVLLLVALEIGDRIVVDLGRTTVIRHELPSTRSTLRTLERQWATLVPKKQRYDLAEAAVAAEKASGNPVPGLRTLFADLSPHAVILTLSTNTNTIYTAVRFPSFSGAAATVQALTQSPLFVSPVVNTIDASGGVVTATFSLRMKAPG
jgi:hypothetical protein